MKKYTPGWRDRKDEMKNFESSQRRVQFLKFAIPTVIIVLLIFTFMWPRINSWKNNSSSNNFEQKIKQNPEMKNKILNPIFESLDKSGKPVLIKSEIANQVSKNITDFENPSGKIFLDNGKWVKFWSETGKHKKDEEILDLKGNVKIVTEDGYDILTDTASILIKEKRGFGNDEVNGTGPVGETIKSEGFKLNHFNQTINFTGKTKISYPTLKKDKL